MITLSCWYQHIRMGWTFQKPSWQLPHVPQGELPCVSHHLRPLAAPEARTSLDTGDLSMGLTQLSLFTWSHTGLEFHSVDLPRPASSKDTGLRLAGSPQGVSAGPRAQARPRFRQWESLTSVPKVIVFGLCIYS